MVIKGCHFLLYCTLHAQPCNASQGAFKISRISLRDGVKHAPLRYLFSKNPMTLQPFSLDLVSTPPSLTTPTHPPILASMLSNLQFFNIPFGSMVSKCWGRLSKSKKIHASLYPAAFTS